VEEREKDPKSAHGLFWTTNLKGNKKPRRESEKVRSRGKGDGIITEVSGLGSYVRGELEKKKIRKKGECRPGRKKVRNSDGQEPEKQHRGITEKYLRQTKGQGVLVGKGGHLSAA